MNECRQTKQGSAMIRLALHLLLFFAGLAAYAEEPAHPVLDARNSYPATFADKRADNAPFVPPSKEVSFAMCGMEAHGAKSDLDAGLIDFNVPDPARYAGGEIEEDKTQGKNARDYRSSVVLGVTLGYRF